MIPLSGLLSSSTDRALTGRILLFYDAGNKLRTRDGLLQQ